MDDPWSGSIWVRTKCTSNDTYYFSCETGDCGSGERDCQGPPPVYPVTLLNFNISQNAVSYELSLVHGHNIAVQIRPDGGSLVDGGSGPCPIVECIGDISNVCPASLVVKNKDGVYVGCNNPCDVLNDPNYCRANDISTRFKQLCSSAHTYPGDNSPPIYKCSGATRPMD
ncbi:hypothetical protein JCGZ_18764 [Jatropha curcas]|uniref:Thaumatin-like protein n=1 Tax=Jatropha curcas TaxID=180498 RepID=A0A067K1I6_JATCU|nr:hypothetical protein JCGZ_18764 [Jatropha curcas]